MRAFARIIIPPNAEGRGSANEYVIEMDSTVSGEEVAQVITAAVDTRPDLEGRLAELRRHLVALRGRAVRVNRKPSGAKVMGARVRYNAMSRMTDKVVTVELRHFDKTPIAPNSDEPADG